MIALGLDPSLTAFGYAVLERPELIGSEPGPRRLNGAGVWQTSPDPDGLKHATDMARRFAYLAEQLWDITERIRPAVLVVEGVVYMPKTTFNTISTLGRCRGVVDMLAAARHLPLIELAPQTVKSSLGIVRPPKAQGMASKDEVRKAVCRLYPNANELLPKGKVGDNASDAVAIAHVGMVQMEQRARASAW